MTNNNLILRTLNSGFPTPFQDTTLGSVLSHADLDNNFIYLKSEIIYTATTSGTVVNFNKIGGNNFYLDLAPIIDATDNYTTGATLNGTVLEFDRNDSTNTYSVDMSSLDWTGGTNYILVKAEGTGTQNAEELQTAYDLAISMSATAINRITIVASPGYYNFSSAFVMDEECIDLVSLDGNRSIIFNGTATIQILANDVFVKGIDVGTKPFFGGGSSLNKIEDCRGGINSFGGGPSGTASGTFIDCVGGQNTFGGGPGATASGTFINCIGGLDSFGGTGTASGTFTNCEGGQNSFGGNGGTASGTFTNCIGSVASFGGILFGMGGTASGTFTNCIGSFGSFGGNGGTLTGRVIKCQLTSGTFQPPTGSGIIILGIDGNDDIINLTV